MNALLPGLRRDQIPSVVFEKLGAGLVERETGCVEWLKATSGSDNGRRGYGLIKYGRKINGHQTSYRTHRVAYVLVKGDIAEGMTIDHLCRNTLCANTDHLEMVTGRINTLRGVGASAMNAKKTHCPSGHEYTLANTTVKRGERFCRACDRAYKRRVRYGESAREGARGEKP